MSKKRSGGLSRALDRVARAFSTKDERAFDEAMDNLEEKLEEKSEDTNEDPDTIEVHNHIPDSMMRDTGRGELPEKDPPGFDRARDEEEAPPWFKKHQEDTDKRFKSMNDSIENLIGKKKEEEEEHSEDRRDRRDNELEEEDLGNLEMEDRHRDRRGRDEPSEREDMAERIKERGGDRRGSDKRDEANKEILGELEFEAPPGTGDRARKARDSQYLEDAFQDAIAKAEVLAPGLALPTFDRAAPPAKTFLAIHKLRKTAIDLAYNQPTTRGIFDQAMSGKTVDTKAMPYATTRVLFNTVATAAGMANNHRATDRSTTDTHRGQQAGVQSIGDWNKRNREYYGRKSA